MTDMQENAPSRRWLKVLIPVAIAVVVTGASLSAYLVERSQGQTVHTMGEDAAPDRLDVQFYVQKVDPVAEEVSAQVFVQPAGRFADQDGMPANDITLYVNAIKGDVLSFKAGKNPSVADVRVPLTTGVITDYPFDRYGADFGFYAETAADSVPVNVTFSSADSFFRLEPGQVKSESGGLEFSATASRTAGMFAFAIFIMIFMWCLSISAVIAALYAVGGRHGLLWPSMSFMGALLFALVPLRNAVPGSPPIGSVVDFGSFFIAETLISLSLITTVVVGYRTELRKKATA
jgi:hypothetical protein